MKNSKRVISILLTFILTMGIVCSFLPLKIVNAIQNEYPIINFLGEEHYPLIHSEIQGFFVTCSNYDGMVQYKLLINKEGSNEWGNLGGYTSEVYGKSIYKINADRKFEIGNYNVRVCVKKAGTSGINKSKYCDYDSYVVTRLNCIKSNSRKLETSGKINIKKNTFDLGENINIQGIKRLDNAIYKLSYLRLDKNKQYTNNNWITYSEKFESQINWRPQKPGMYFVSLGVNTKDSNLPYRGLKKFIINVIDPLQEEISKTIIDAVKYEKARKSFDDWDIISLKMLGYDVNSSEFYKNGKDFITLKENDIKENFKNYSQSTYARSILSVLACQYNPSDIADINLVKETKKLLMEKSDFINENIWSIIALEANNEEYNREKTIEYLEKCQNKDGSFSLISGIEKNAGDLDVTAMAIDAFIMAGKNKNYKAVSKALEYLKLELKALEKKPKEQNVETLSQILTAAIIANDDLNEYTINGNKIMKEILTYRANDGGFKHVKNGVSNQMSTQQALMAVAFYENYDNMFKNIGKSHSAKIINTYGESYGSENNKNIMNFNGNIKVNANNVKLNNIKCIGDIILDPGKNGNVYLKNVEVNKIKVLSGGINSIHLDGVKAAIIDVDANENVRVENQNKTSILNTYINSNTILDNINGDFGDIEIKDKGNNSSKTVDFRGTFNNSVIVNSNVDLKTSSKTKIKNIQVGKSKYDVNMTMNGIVENIEILNNANVKILSGSHIDNIKALAPKINVNIEKGAVVGKIYKNNNEVELKDETQKVEVIEDNTQNNSKENKDNNGDIDKGKNTFKLVVSKNMHGYISSSIQSEKIIEKEIEIVPGKSALDYLKENTNVEMSGALISSIHGVRRLLKYELSSEQKRKNIFGVDWFVYKNGSKTNVGADSVIPDKGDVMTFDYHEWNWKVYLGDESLSINVLPGQINKGESVTVRVSLSGEPICGAIVYSNGIRMGVTNSSGIVVMNFNSGGNYSIYAEADGINTESVSVIVNDTGSSGNTDSGKGEVNPGDEGHKKNDLIVNVDGINRSISIENKEAKEDIVVIRLYDTSGTIIYVNQVKLVDGKYGFKTQLPQGDYHGYAKGLTTNKVEIKTFTFNPVEIDKNKLVVGNMSVILGNNIITIENQKALDDDISIILYDEFNSMVYISYAKLVNGQYILNIPLDKGIYHGVIKGESTKKLEISNFNIN